MLSALPSPPFAFTPPVPDDFKQAIEQIKLRIPIEEVVREKVPGLRKQGALWTACCPFHEEGTPSFKVDPRKGTWRCYGACAAGGDVIEFLLRHDHLDFREALDVLSVRAGVELPGRGAPRKPRGADDPLYEVLERACQYYKRTLHRPEGAQALAYLRGRGLSATTIEAFGLGFAPAGGEVLVSKVIAQEQPLEPLIASGLARRNEQGRPYDFFRGRLMIPIRDDKGRTVGFGARRLDDADKHSPKYVNTTETEVFHKGRLIYALDHAQAEVRRSGHMVLVEGYTDVMAAHQAGVRNVVAVLGTALTEEHAALVRRCGAKRVTLCFDGDGAGQQASWRALNGLLPLELEIDVVRLRFPAPASGSAADAIKDPCDLLVRHGAAAFQEQLAHAVGWFDFLKATLDTLADQERWQAVDRVLELLARLSKPIQCDARLTELAAHLGLSADAVRAQFEALPSRSRERYRKTRAAIAPTIERETSRASAGPQAIMPRPAGGEATQLRAWRELVGAVLLDASLVEPLAQLLDDPRHACKDDALVLLARELVLLAAQRGRLPDIDGIHAALGMHPASDLVVPLIEEAAVAESPGALFAGARAHLERCHAQSERIARIAELARLSPTEHQERLTQLHQELRREKFATTKEHDATARS